MPSRASTSLLQRSPHVDSSTYFMCQCPLGLMPHCYEPEDEEPGSDDTDRVNALSGCYLISTFTKKFSIVNQFIVSMPSRAVTSFLRRSKNIIRSDERICVNALSGCYLISTGRKESMTQERYAVSMPSRAVTSFLLDVPANECMFQDVGVNALSGCYLISTAWGERYYNRLVKSVNALSGCYLISTQEQTQRQIVSAGVNALSGCYLISTVPLQKPRFYAVSRACFCRYLSEYSDSNSFSCMLTIWTYLMRQIILLTLI